MDPSKFLKINDYLIFYKTILIFLKPVLLVINFSKVVCNIPKRVVGRTGELVMTYLCNKMKIPPFLLNQLCWYSQIAATPTVSPPITAMSSFSLQLLIMLVSLFPASLTMMPFGSVMMLTRVFMIDFLT